MEDAASYRIYTQPAEVHKAINTLRGIVAGIQTDRKLSCAEVDELIHWVNIHAYLRNKHPFSEIIPIVEAACEDGQIDDEEAQDIIWVCSSFADCGNYYNAIVSSIHFLSGMVHGMLADAQLTDKEITALSSWVNAHSFLESTYPFDEINALLTSILADGKIEEDERNTLIAFLSNLIEYKDSYNLVEEDFASLREKYSVAGICSSSPYVHFKNKSFCFTGESMRGSRKALMLAARTNGGIVKTEVSGQLDYLVVGALGNPCWKYACYGRKIDEAMKLRKAGKNIQIISEIDFWDAVDDFLCGIS